MPGAGPALAGEWVLAGATLPHHVGQWAASRQDTAGVCHETAGGNWSSAPPPSV